METVGHSKIHVAMLHSSKPKLKGILCYFVYNNENVICGTGFFIFFWFLNSKEFLFFERNYTEKTKKKIKFFSKCTSQNDKGSPQTIK